MFGRTNKTDYDGGAFLELAPSNARMVVKREFGPAFSGYGRGLPLRSSLATCGS
jgi:hypothetical protein